MKLPVSKMMVRTVKASTVTTATSTTATVTASTTTTTVISTTATISTTVTTSTTVTSTGTSVATMKTASSLTPLASGPRTKAPEALMALLRPTSLPPRPKGTRVGTVLAPDQGLGLASTLGMDTIIRRISLYYRRLD